MVLGTIIVNHSRYYVCSYKTSVQFIKHVYTFGMGNLVPYEAFFVTALKLAHIEDVNTHIYYG